MSTLPQDFKIAFFGTPSFAVDVLEELYAAHIVPAVVVAAPDAPRGRGLKLTPPETKVWADGKHIPTLQPHTLRLTTDDSDRDILYNSEWDLFVVASYGFILPQALLNLPRFGTLNVHPSLLPLYRGASPIRSAILEDNPDAVGISIMLLDAGMDTGPIIAQARVTLDRETGDWPPSALMLERLLAHEGGALLAEVLPEWISGHITPEPQDHARATYTSKITKDMGLVSLTDDPWHTYLKIRALEGWPGTYFFAHKKDGRDIRVKIVEAIFEQGTLSILRVIPEGKKEMAYQDFLHSLA